MSISQAFIFAAGRGERMRPLTDNLPKPLVKIHDNSLLDRAIFAILQLPSIKKITINGFYLAEQIASHIAKINNSKLEFSHEQEKLETGGGLLYALKNQKIDATKPLLIANGDVFWIEKSQSQELRKFCDEFEKSDCDILLVLKKKEDYFGYDGAGDFDFAGKIAEVREVEAREIFYDENKTEKSYAFVGLQIINPKILQKSPPEKCFSMSYFYKNAKKLGLKMAGIELDANFFHIGDVDSLRKANEMEEVSVRSDRVSPVI